MARIKIKDLPKDMKISKEEQKRIMGGYDVITILTGTSIRRESSEYEMSYSSTNPVPEKPDLK